MVPQQAYRNAEIIFRNGFDAVILGTFQRRRRSVTPIPFRNNLSLLFHNRLLFANAFVRLHPLFHQFKIRDKTMG